MILEAFREKLSRLGIQGVHSSEPRGELVLGGLPEDLRNRLTSFDPARQNAVDVLHEVATELKERQLPNPRRLDLRDMMDLMERSAYRRRSIQVIEGGKK